MAHNHITHYLTLLEIRYRAAQREAFLSSGMFL